jgi:membrane protease YdiL (CAAX protease family)
VLGYGAFMLTALVYTLVLAPDGQQSVADDLGVDESTLALVAAGVLIVVFAPIAEELFFRGFFYKALRSRFGVLTAAAIDGGVFGLIHYTGTETLELLPMLALLGFIFCLIYEKTGSLYTVIALHALNNSIAYGFEAENAVVALILGSLILAACIAGPRFFHSRRTAAA